MTASHLLCSSTTASRRFVWPRFRMLLDSLIPECAPSLLFTVYLVILISGHPQNHRLSPKSQISKNILALLRRTNTSFLASTNGNLCERLPILRKGRYPCVEVGFRCITAIGGQLRCRGRLYSNGGSISRSCR